MATVTSKAEGDFVRKLAGEENIWLGASDGAVEEEWRWVQGPEHGTMFWKGSGTKGSPQGNNYANWRAHEPNNADSVKDEDCAAMGPTGEWNDVPCTQFTGLVVEYGDEPIPQEQSQQQQGAGGSKQEL